MMKLSHEQARQLIHKRTMNRLGEGEETKLEQHLLGCGICRAYTAEVMALRAPLQGAFERRWPETRRSNHDLAKVLRRVESPGRVIPAPQLAMGFLAFLAIALLGLYVTLYFSAPTPEPAVADLNTPTFASQPTGETAGETAGETIAEMPPTPHITIIQHSTATSLPPLPPSPTSEADDPASPTPVLVEESVTSHATATEPAPLMGEAAIEAGGAVEGTLSEHWSNCLPDTVLATDRARGIRSYHDTDNVTVVEMQVADYLDSLNARCENKQLLYEVNRAIAFYRLARSCVGVAPPPAPTPDSYVVQDEANINQLLSQNYTVILLVCYPPPP